MTEKNLNISFGGLGGMIIAGILGYFVYGQSTTGVLGMMLLAILFGLLMLISIIPIIGFPIYAYVGWYHLIPAVLDFVSLEPTWLTTGIFLFNSIVGFIIWIVMSGFVVLKLYDSVFR